jgi:hypothetical protein
MSPDEKRRLLELLDQTHAATRETLAGIDLELPVYPDSGWRIRDILGHIAAWDRQVAKSLSAYRDGHEYALADHDEAAFNKQSIAEQQAIETQQLFEEWEKAREEFENAVDEIPIDQFPGDVLYPWGDERSTIALLVETMAEHDVEHHNEIVKALELKP